MRRCVAVVLLVAVAGLVVAGCGSPSGPSGPSGQRSAGNLGTNVCITNDTGAQVSVTFTKSDTNTGAGLVPAGGVACGEGTFFLGDDVSGVISEGLPDALVFSASNPWVGEPTLSVQDGRSPAHGICPAGGWDVNQSYSTAFPTVAVEATRRADDGWKEFTIVLTPGDGTSRAELCLRPGPGPL